MAESEKIYYEYYFDDVKLNYRKATYMWGEDLVNKKLVVFSGGISKVYGYKNFRDNLCEIKLIVVKERKKEPLKVIDCKYDNQQEKVYIDNFLFEQNWQYIRKSVKVGMQIAYAKGSNTIIKKPEDIVVLKEMNRKNSMAYLENDKIIYKARERSPEEVKYEAARHSALDNLDNICFYSKNEDIVHDKLCESLNLIADRDFAGAKIIPDGKEMCPKCARLILIRKGCEHKGKEVSIINRFFMRHGLKTSYIAKIVEEKNIKFHCKDLEEMYVKGTEDSWKIVVDDEQKLALWHNNYVKTSPVQRYITDGYHLQKIGNYSLAQIFNYISEYSWEKHLHNQEVRAHYKSAMTMENGKNEQEVTDDYNLIESLTEINSEINKKNEIEMFPEIVETRKAGIWKKIKKFFGF